MGLSVLLTRGEDGFGDSVASGEPSEKGNGMGSQSLVIRLAQRGDVEAIAAIHAASWQATYAGMVDAASLAKMTAAARRPMWEQVLESDDARFAVLVAEVDGVVAGFCSVGPSRTFDNAGQLYTIYLEPGREGKGLGHTLLTAAEGALREQGYRLAILWVLRENRVARAFYERHGWTATDEEIEDEIFGTLVTELRYVKPLTGS